MDYCGVAVGAGDQHLCVLREVRVAEPPVRLEATFYEPGSPDQVAAQVRRLEEVVVAIAAPQSGAPPEGPPRACDVELERRGVAPRAFAPGGAQLFADLSELGVFLPVAAPTAVPAAAQGRVEEGAFGLAAVFETNVDGVFCALQGRRLPARRHPLGVARRIEELLEDHVEDPGGDLWHRRIEEVEAAAAALVAHRYALGHASWLGDPDEGVVVLPGAHLPERFSAEGVLPPVAREPLPAVPAASPGR